MMSTLNVNDDDSHNTTADKSNNDNDNDICANCGKGEEASINLKSCAACKMVKYCSRDCQAAHRPQHKKACKKRAAELRDELLFKQPPQLDDCPICFIRMPLLDSGRIYMSCCGKEICKGCIHAFQSRKNDVCPFCRSRPPKSDAETIERSEKRVENNNAQEMFNLASYYHDGLYGLHQNRAKALELWRRAAELGHAEAQHNIGYLYSRGDGLEMDKEKAVHYWELAAMGGNVTSRYNLGLTEAKAGNKHRAMKHWMIAIELGSKKALVEGFQRMYKNGHTTKAYFEKALRARQAYLDEIRSDQRDEAAADKENDKYID